MSLTLIAANRNKVSPFRLFKDAMAMHEVRLSQDNLEEYYEECAVSDLYPTIVEDYALRVLAGDIKYVHQGEGEKDSPPAE